MALSRPCPGLLAPRPLRPFSVTTHCFSRITHLRVWPRLGAVDCGQGGKSALVSIRNWLRFVFHVGQQGRRASGVPGLPSRRQIRHFGFVPSSWQGDQWPPAIIAISAAFRKHVDGLYVEVLYFQWTISQERNPLYDLASFRHMPPSRAAPSLVVYLSTRDNPGYHWPVP